VLELSGRLHESKSGARGVVRLSVHHRHHINRWAPVACVVESY
jgi:hypothetical protein